MSNSVLAEDTKAGHWGDRMSEVIDDKWAAVWPRRWVMVRDDGSDPWKGPYRLLGRATYCPWEYVTDRGPFGQCRPATPEEIATVEPAAASTKLPDPGPGWRIASGDDWRDERCEMWMIGQNKWSPRAYPGQRFCKGDIYRIPIDKPQPNEQIAVKEANPSDEMARYLELKRLAESVIGSVLIAQPENMCHQSAIAAWDVAEAMYAESERRRPK